MSFEQLLMTGVGSSPTPGLDGVSLGFCGKESACSAVDIGRIHGFVPGLGKIPGRRKWQPTPGFLPGKSQSMGWQGVGHGWETIQGQIQN